MNTDPDLESPSFDQCQAMVRPKHGPFILGPKPRHEQCRNKPVWIATEIIAGTDGKQGSMSLCQECADAMLKIEDLRTRVMLTPIRSPQV